MDAEHIKTLLKANRERLFIDYPLSSLALFGSYADGTATENSNVDILVELKQPLGFEFIDLSIELESLLRKPVDLVTRKAIKLALIPYVMQQLYYV